MKNYLKYILSVIYYSSYAPQDAENATDPIVNMSLTRASAACISNTTSFFDEVTMQYTNIEQIQLRDKIQMQVNNYIANNVTFDANNNDQKARIIESFETAITIDVVHPLLYARSDIDKTVYDILARMKERADTTGDYSVEEYKIDVRKLIDELHGIIRIITVLLDDDMMKLLDIVTQKTNETNAIEFKIISELNLKALLDKNMSGKKPARISHDIDVPDLKNAIRNWNNLTKMPAKLELLLEKDIIDRKAYDIFICQLCVDINSVQYLKTSIMHDIYTWNEKLSAKYPQLLTEFRQAYPIDRFVKILLLIEFSLRSINLNQYTHYLFAKIYHFVDHALLQGYFRNTIVTDIDQNGDYKVSYIYEIDRSTESEREGLIYRNKL